MFKYVICNLLIMYNKNLTPMQSLLVKITEWWYERSLTEKEINDIILRVNIGGILINACIETYKEITKYDNYIRNRQLPDNSIY